MSADKRAETRPHPSAVCPMCEGEGVVLANASVHSLARVDVVVCPDCEGTGERSTRS